MADTEMPRPLGFFAFFVQGLKYLHLDGIGVKFISPVYCTEHEDFS